MSQTYDLHFDLSFLIFFEKFGCLKNADIILLLDAPYNAPIYDFVFESIKGGVKICSQTILSRNETLSFLDIFSITIFLSFF